MTQAMRQHTPGPWEAADLSGHPVNDPSVLSAKHCLATVWINDIPRRQAAANARLMASAPAMLAALREAEAVLTIVPPRNSKREYLACLDRVRAAIAKAEGREP